MRITPRPSPDVTLTRVTLPLPAAGTCPELRVRCRPVVRVHVAVIRYRDGAIDRVLGTADSDGTATWQDVVVRAPLALATPDDVVVAVVSGAADFGPIEIEPPPVTPARLVGAAARTIASKLAAQPA